MELDAVLNFSKVTLSTGYNSAATTVILSSGDGARLPDPSGDGEFNLVYWDWTDYKDPADDPDREIVRCTSRSSDTLTITRAQEGTTAANHNTGGKTYKMVLAITKKMIDDISARTAVGGTDGSVLFNDVNFIGGNGGLMYDKTNFYLGINTQGQIPSYSLQMGKITDTPDAPTGTTAVFDYSMGGGYPGDGYTHTYRVYSYRETGIPQRIYSETYDETAPITDDGMGNSYNVIIDNFVATGTIDGYRILIQDNYGGFNFNAGYDAVTGPLTDTAADFTSDGTVTPTSIIPYAWIDSVGNSSFSGDMMVYGAINANSYNGVDLTMLVPYSGSSMDLDMGSHFITASSYYGDGSNLTGINETQWLDTTNGIYYGNNVGVGALTDKLSTLTVQSIGLISVSGTTNVNGSTGVTGTGTAFLSEFGQGDRIILSGGNEAFVTEISSDTNLTVDVPIGNGTTQSIQKHAASGSFIDSRGNLTAFIDSETATFYMWQSARIKSVLYLDGDFTTSDGARMLFGTSSGFSFGSSISQKLAFWNTAPIAQPSNSTAIDLVLSNTGLRASGGVSNFSATIKPRAGNTSSTTIPVQYTSGPLLTSAAVGAFEFLTDSIYITITTGTARKEITLNDIALTSGRMPFSTTNGRLTDSSTLTYSASTGLSTANDIKLNTAGNGIYIKEGTNATMGVVTLSSGTATVSTTKVTANSRIHLTTNGGTVTNIGVQYVSARTAGTSFTISSLNVLDSSTVAWMIVEPA